SITGMAVLLLLVRPIVSHHDRFAQSDQRGDPSRLSGSAKLQIAPTRRLCCCPARASATNGERHMRANRTEYLFSVNTHTPPTMTVDSGEEFTIEVRGAFDDIDDISAVPTPFTPACDGHPPRADNPREKCNVIVFPDSERS